MSVIINTAFENNKNLFIERSVNAISTSSAPKWDTLAAAVDISKYQIRNALGTKQCITQNAQELPKPTL